MATVRLEFDLDSDVYPELHAALAGLADAGSRGERMRQLATAGLVWENVRIHGAAAIGPTPVARPAPAPVSAVEVEAVPERKPPRPRKVPARRKDDVRGPDFIDLAIDAEPAPAAPVAVERRKAPRDLPVLMDVVADEEVEDSRVMALGPVTEPAPLPLAVDEPTEEVFVLSAESHHIASLAEKPQARSRLMRMKERGLFKNG